MTTIPHRVKSIIIMGNIKKILLDISIINEKIDIHVNKNFNVNVHIKIVNNVECSSDTL